MSLGLGLAASEKHTLSHLCISYLTSICASLHFHPILYQHYDSREPKQRDLKILLLHLGWQPHKHLTPSSSWEVCPWTAKWESRPSKSARRCLWIPPPYSGWVGRDVSQHQPKVYFQPGLENKERKLGSAILSKINKGSSTLISLLLFFIAMYRSTDRIQASHIIIIWCNNFFFDFRPTQGLHPSPTRLCLWERWEFYRNLDVPFCESCREVTLGHM